MAEVTINGQTFSDDADPDTGLAGGGHRTRFIPALQAIVWALAQFQGVGLPLVEVISASEEEAAYAAGARLVLRLDLLPGYVTPTTTTTAAPTTTTTTAAPTTTTTTAAPTTTTTTAAPTTTTTAAPTTTTTTTAAPNYFIETWESFSTATNGWTVNDGGLAYEDGMFISNNTANAYSSSYGFIMGGSATDEEFGPWADGFIEKTLNVATGNITFYAKSEGAVGVQIYVKRNGTTIGTANLTTNWQQFSFPVTGGTSVTIRFTSNYADTGSSDIDNISIPIP